MYRFLVILLLISVPAHGQVMKGIVTDADSGTALYPVIVTDLRTHQSVATDEHGVFHIDAAIGDNIVFMYVGYKNVQRAMTQAMDGSAVTVRMEKNSIALKEYTFRSLTPYQQDSEEMHQMFDKELAINPVKPKVVSTGSGIGVNGLIGSVVQKMSKSYKRNKAFKAQFKTDEEQRFIDTRYTPELTAQLTNLAGDTLSYFMNAYPMDYAFARTATDLELKMWIRDNYRQYLARKKDSEGRVIDNQ